MVVNEDLSEKGKFELPLDRREGMNHVDIERKRTANEKDCVTGKDMRSLCAIVHLL